MPTDEHQRIVLFLYRALYAFLAARGLGIVLVAPLRLRLRTGRYREPDVLLLLSATDARRSNRYWTGADLVLEVVSPDDPKRDLVRKRRSMPEQECMKLDRQSGNGTDYCAHLEGTAYVEHGIFMRGTQATSVLLEGFTVAVAAVGRTVSAYPVIMKVPAGFGHY